VLAWTNAAHRVPRRTDAGAVLVQMWQGWYPCRLRRTACPAASCRRSTARLSSIASGAASRRAHPPTSAPHARPCAATCIVPVHGIGTEVPLVVNLQFIYCKPNAEGEYNDHDLFGDGLIWSADPAPPTGRGPGRIACKPIRKLWPPT